MALCASLDNWKENPFGQPNFSSEMAQLSGFKLRHGAFEAGPKLSHACALPSKHTGSPRSVCVCVVLCVVLCCAPHVLIFVQRSAVRRSADRLCRRSSSSGRSRRRRLHLFACRPLVAFRFCRFFRCLLGFSHACDSLPASAPKLRTWLDRRMLIRAPGSLAA